MGLRTFTTVRELLQCYCSPVCGLPTQWVWNWILSQLHTSYYLTVASSLSVDVGYLFLVGFNSLLLMAVQEFKTVAILAKPSITYDFYCFLLYYYTKTSSIILSRSDESKNPCLFNILGKSIQYFTINCDTACGFFTDAL